MQSIPNRTSIPNPTAFFFLMAAMLAWSLWSEDPGPASLAAGCVVAAVVCGGLVYVLSQRPLFAVVGLVAAGTMSRLYVLVFGLKARPEHVAVVLFCLALPFWQRRETQRPHWMLPDLLLVLYVASNLLSSVVMSINPAKTLRWSLLQTLVILPYFLLRTFCTNVDRFKKVFRILLVVGAAQAAVGVFCFLCNLIFGSEFGMEIGQYGDIPGTYGMNYEANILAAISAAALVMMITMYLKEGRRVLLWGIAITYAGMLIALARAAIIAAVMALGLLVIVSIRARLAHWSHVKGLVRTLLIASLIVLPIVIPLYVERFTSLDVSDISADGDTAGRVVVMVSAADGIMAHPLMGNGTASFQLLMSNEELGFGDGSDSGAWIGNTEMRVLHDTGIVGFTLLLCFLGSLFLRAKEILKRELKLELLALLFGCVVYGFTFQATEGTLLEFFWVHIGLIGCAVAIFQNSQSRPADTLGQQNSGARA
jgi:hypothetical protein